METAGTSNRLLKNTVQGNDDLTIRTWTFPPFYAGIRATGKATFTKPKVKK